MSKWYCAALVCVGLVGSVRPAYAYIDPGTGSIILQTIIGGVAAGAIAIKLYWSKVKERFFPDRSDRELMPRVEPLPS